MAVEISSNKVTQSTFGIPVCKLAKNKAIFVSTEDLIVKRVDYLTSSNKYKVVKLAKLKLNKFGQLSDITVYGNITADVVEKARRALLGLNNVS